MSSYSILPADRYQVFKKTILNDTDYHHLLSFYSPIIGPLAVSLYFSLWQDANDVTNNSFLLHHHLLSILKCTSKSLKEARESLEAVGLLKTFVKEENVLVYIYELYSPLEPEEFLNHPILSSVLKSNLGSDEYTKIVKEYQISKPDLTGFIEITSKMDEIYKVESLNEIDNLQKKELGSIKLTSRIDYDLIIDSLPKDVLSKDALSQKNRDFIDNLSFIYDLDTLRIIEYIRTSLNEFGMIDLDLLRDTVEKNYQINHNSPPTLVYKTQPEYLKKGSGDTSKRAQIIKMFESISPYDYLKTKNKGASPTAKDLKLVESLLNDLELTPAVVNVLLDYCLKKNNNKLTTNYVETIAAQWKREDLKTAEDAMNFAEKEHKKLTKKTSVKEKKNTIEPSWFNEKIEKTEASEAEAEELEELLKEFK